MPIKLIDGCGKVSIPQSEFCPLGLGYSGRCLHGVPCFNSSVGILSVGTKLQQGGTAEMPKVSIPQSEFCPLGQGEMIRPQLPVPRVSIPQSEFCPLGRDPGFYIQGTHFWVSIPQSEFCPLGRFSSLCWDDRSPSFNSSVGILSVGTKSPRP